MEVLLSKSNCDKICLNLFHKNSTTFTSIIALFLNFSSKLEGIIIAGGEYFSFLCKTCCWLGVPSRLSRDAQVTPEAHKCQQRRSFTLTLTLFSDSSHAMHHRRTSANNSREEGEAMLSTRAGEWASLCLPIN